MSRQEMIATAAGRAASAVPASYGLTMLLAGNVALLTLLDANGLIPRWLESVVALFLLF